MKEKATVSSQSRSSDSLFAWILGFGLASAFVLFVMMFLRVPFILYLRSGSAEISIGFVLIAIFVFYLVNFLFRNLGGICCVLCAASISGTTMMSIFRTSFHESSYGISWLQFLAAFLLICGAIVGLIRMEVDWSDVDLHDIFQ